MTDLFFTYLHISFLGSVMILAILLLRPLLCKAPRNISCILWLLVAMRLLLPFQLESPISLQPKQLSEPITATDSVEVSPIPDQEPAMDWIEVSPAPDQEPVTDWEDVPPSPDQLPITEPVLDLSSPLTHADEAITKEPISPQTLLSIIWGCGILAVLLYVCVSYGILWHRIRDAVKVPDDIWESDHITGAFLLGYIKPHIYIPSGLSDPDRGFIITHERTHLRRGDHWWKLVGMLCLSIHWFNPLVWLAYALLCRDIEVACDQQVIRSMELEERKSYSFALLNSGKRLSGFLAYPVAFGEISLKSRIKNVLNYRKPALWASLSAIIVAVVIALCFMTTPSKQGASQENSATEPQQEVVTLPTEETTTPTTVPAEPVTEPTENATVPTEPTVETKPQPTEPPPTEPQPTEPKPTGPKPTEPKPTEPKPTEPTPVGPQNIAEGKWLGRTLWSISSDGVLTLTGTRHIDGASYVDNYPWMPYKKQITKIVVGDGITTLPSCIFQGLSKVTEVSLPSTVEQIDSAAFQECSSLKSITIPAKLQTLESGVFFLCTSLRSISFAEGCQLETIKGSAFESTALIEFHAPASLKSIEAYAFAGCTSLQVLDLWQCSASAHQKAFNECSGIKKVLLGKGSSISQYTYPNWYQIESAKLYSNFHEQFSNRPQLQSVEIGGRATEIPFNAFKDCSALSQVTITAPITSVEMNAFMNCSSLTSLTLPDTVTEILHNSLSGTSIKSFTVPASVVKLSSGVFKNSALEQITFLGDAPNIGDTAFDGISATAYYPADNETWTKDKLKNYGGKITWVPTP